MMRTIQCGDRVRLQGSDTVFDVEGVRRGGRELLLRVGVQPFWADESNVEHVVQSAVRTTPRDDTERFVFPEIAADGAAQPDLEFPR